MSTVVCLPMNQIVEFEAWPRIRPGGAGSAAGVTPRQPHRKRPTTPLRTWALDHSGVRTP